MNPVKGLPARVQHRVIVALVVVVVAISSAPAVHGQSYRTPVTTSRVGVQSAGSSSAAQVSRSTATLGGTVSGVIFWDEGRVAYNPSVPCQALELELDAITGTGTQKVAVLNQFQPVQPVRSGPGLGICNYSFSHVPEGVALLMQLSVGLPFSTQVIAKGPFPLNGTATTLIKVPGGQCNNPPPSTTPSSTYFESGWVGCGDHTYNVNFQLLPRGATAPLAPRASMLLQQAPVSKTPSQPMLLQRSSQPGAAAPGSGMLTPVVKPATGATAGTKANSSAHAALKPIKLTAPKALRRAVNPELAQKNAALFTQLMQQRQAVDQQSTQMKLAAQASTTAAASTVASGTRTAVPAVQMQTKATTQIGPETTQDSTGSSPFHVINRNYWEPPAIACHQNPAPRILSAPPVFTPEAKYNSFAISGCGFGASSNGNTAYIYGVNGFRENLSIDFWSDLGITAHFDPTVAIGVLDQNNVTLVVAPSGRQEMQKSGFRFYAARGMPAADGSDQEVALAYDSLAQSRVNLSSVVGVGHDTNGGDATALGNILGPGFDQASANFKADSGYSFQGTPVSGWVLRYVYGHTDEENSLLYPENWFTWNDHPISCYINDVSYQDGSGTHACAAYFARLLSFGADTWDFSGLAPGFVISSYNLYYADPAPRSLCGAWDETSHDDGIVGSWYFSLSGSQISVTWPVYWCQDTEAMPFARVNQQELSAYGVAVWVMGPRCVDPWSGQSDQVCVAKVRQILGN